MPYVSPADVSPGNVAPASWGDSVKAGLDYLANPPACRVYHNANQSIPHAAETIAVFNSERYDTDSMHSTSVNTDRITFNTAGLYLVTFTGMFVVGTDWLRGYALITAYGGAYGGGQNIGQGAFTGNGAASTFPQMMAATVQKFAAGDYVRARVYHVNGASAARNLEVHGGQQTSPEFSATWIGLG